MDLAGSWPGTTPQPGSALRRHQFGRPCDQLVHARGAESIGVELSHRQPRWRGPGGYVELQPQSRVDVAALTRRPRWTGDRAAGDQPRVESGRAGMVNYTLREAAFASGPFFGCAAVSAGTCCLAS